MKSNSLGILDPRVVSVRPVRRPTDPSPVLIQCSVTAPALSERLTLAMNVVWILLTGTSLIYNVVYLVLL